MAVQKKTLADTVLAALDEESYEHFRYNKLYLNSVRIDDKEAVTKYLQEEYLAGKTMEEFALACILDGIKKDVSKYSIKRKEMEKSEKPTNKSTEQAATAKN